jgi:lambda repressor-like predicted transcriptional regulator
MQKIKLNKHRIIEAAENKGINLTQLNKLLGINPQTLTNRLRQGFRVADAEYLARVLGVELVKLQEFLDS